MSTENDVLHDETREMLHAQRYCSFVRFHRNIALLSGVLRADEERAVAPGQEAASALSEDSIHLCTDEDALVERRASIEAECAAMRERHRALLCDHSASSEPGERAAASPKS